MSFHQTHSFPLQHCLRTIQMIHFSDNHVSSPRPNIYKLSSTSKSQSISTMSCKLFQANTWTCIIISTRTVQRVTDKPACKLQRNQSVPMCDIIRLHPDTSTLVFPLNFSNQHWCVAKAIYDGGDDFSLCIIQYLVRMPAWLKHGYLLCWTVSLTITRFPAGMTASGLHQKCVMVNQYGSLTVSTVAYIRFSMRLL